MSDNFSWTPDQIRKLTWSEACHYLHQIDEKRKLIMPPDQSLEMIRTAFFAFLGIKQPKAQAEVNPVLQAAETGMPAYTVKKEDMDAWYAAGCPNPTKFFAERKQKSRKK